MTRGQKIDIGLLHFTCIRMLVAAGLVRVIARRERLAGGMNRLDAMILIWACLALVSSVFHQNPSDAFVFRLGLVYDACSIYFLIRIFCQSLNDMVGLWRILSILLVPLAVAMLFEKVTGHNLFSQLGGVREISLIREGKIRAQGPFGHPILAGTIGAVCLPFAIALWHQHRKNAVAGIAACIVIIFASASSGPIMSFLVAISALFMWHWRNRMRLVRWITVLVYITLDLVMIDPAYFIIARIDLTGGSTGWHRARLIQSAFEHLSEWWLWGTDYTRHWMPSGVSWSPDQADITNYYLYMGVIGGIPLMLFFIAILVKGFSFVGQVLRQFADLPIKSSFNVWTLGTSLFVLVSASISVAFFDQSSFFFYMTLAFIGSAWSVTMRSQ